MTKDEPSDYAKYINVINKDSTGKNIKLMVVLNQSKIDEGLKYVGYNILVTAEIDIELLQVYKKYHSL